MFHYMDIEQKRKTKPKAFVELQERLKKIVGKSLTQARNDLGKSQADVLAELARYGIDRTQGSISQIENGLRLPSLEVLYLTVSYLGTSMDYVLGLSENPDSPSDIEEELKAARENGGRINKIMTHLSKERQKQVLDFAEYLLSQERRKARPAQEMDEWVASTEVLISRQGIPGEQSFHELLVTQYPDLAADLGITAKKKLVQD